MTTRFAETEESPLAVTLPYDFDTISLPRKILSAMVGGSALMVLFALIMLIKSGPLAATPFPLAALLLAWVARSAPFVVAAVAIFLIGPARARATA